jgi:hypothetical protein
MLDEEDDAGNGIERSRRIRQLMPDAILIAITSRVQEVKHDESSAAIFDDVIDKQQAEWKRDDTVRAVLKQTIEAIRAKRAGAVKPGDEIRFRYSLGLHVAETALETSTLREMVLRETDGWSGREVRALTGGYSGSHLIAVNGEHNGLSAQVVLKAARKRQFLEPEAERSRELLPHLDAFAGKVNLPHPGIRTIGSPEVFYCIQASVPGVTLYELFKRGPKAKARGVLQSLLALLTDQYRNAADRTAATARTVESCYSLTGEQVYRIYDTCDRLQGAAESLRKAGQWPRGVPLPRTIFDIIRRIVADWSKHLAHIEVPFWAYQHGDLHPGNILVANDQLTFIDVARFRPWPVGYDISRLATQMRVTLPDHEDNQDWVLNRLDVWSRDSFGGIPSHASEGCTWAQHCDDAFLRFVETRSPSEHKSLKRLYMFSTLSDLLRILTYDTLSHFKRLWASVACCQLGRTLKLSDRT